MTPTPTHPPVVPHRSWCQDAGNVYRITDHGIVVARCRSCRAEALDWPDDADAESLPNRSGFKSSGPGDPRQSSVCAGPGIAQGG
jgi:hypothetical protein